MATKTAESPASESEHAGSPWRRAVLGVGALALALAACSVTRTVNAKDVADEVTRGVARQIGVKVTTSCPTGVEAKADATLTCTVKDGAGTRLPAHVVQKDAHGSVRWSVKAMRIPVVEEQLSATISEKVGTVTVACPARLVSSAKGSVITCTATDPQGHIGRVVATAQDDNGHLSWELNP